MAVSREKQKGMLLDRLRKHVSRPMDLAGRYVACGGLLPHHARLSARREIWTHLTDSPLSFFDRCEHRRRPRPRTCRFLHSISAHRARLAEGSRNASSALSACRFSDKGNRRPHNRKLPNPWQGFERLYPTQAANPNPQLLTFNLQPSTFNLQPSTFNLQP